MPAVGAHNEVSNKVYDAFLNEAGQALGVSLPERDSLKKRGSIRDSEPSLDQTCPQSRHPYAPRDERIRSRYAWNRSSLISNSCVATACLDLMKDSSPGK
jgi:hypothetical protein